MLIAVGFWRELGTIALSIAAIVAVIATWVWKNRVGRENDYRRYAARRDRNRALDERYRRERRR
jgi:type II secretory pathway pseudopilin PulG